LDYSLEEYNESPGVYYEDNGKETLYSVEWQTMVYMHVKGPDNNMSNLRLYIDYIHILC